MNRRWLLWFIVLLTLAALYIALPPLPGNIPLTNTAWSAVLNRFPLRLGLDLQGGTQLVLLADVSKVEGARQDEALDSARSVIERRVNLYGVSEAVVQSSRLGTQKRILVDLPGVQDASQAATLVGKTAQLDFREEPATFSAEATNSAILQLLAYKPTGLTGADLKRSQVVFNSGGNAGPEISLEFTPAGAQKFSDITGRNVGKTLAIFLDDQPIMTPQVNQQIVGGNSVIQGQFTTQQAKSLAIQLNAGALPVPIKILEQRSIGPSLGQESINRSIVAGVIGLVLVMFFMIGYYGWLGVIANLALVIYTLLVLAAFKTGLFILPPITLTLAGIAGFILSIGMAVDANILIFERFKEERRQGKSARIALDLGFKRAWSSIRDSNISSLMTAGVLYFMGTGLIRGFALTLAIGVLISMFTALTVTKTILKLFIR